MYAEIFCGTCFTIAGKHYITVRWVQRNWMLPYEPSHMQRSFKRSCSSGILTISGVDDYLQDSLLGCGAEVMKDPWQGGPSQCAFDCLAKTYIFLGD